MARTKSEPSLITRMGVAKIKADTAKAEYEELAALAREEFSMGSHREGPITVHVQVNRTWNKKKALENFGDDICSMQVDLDVAKKFLTGDEFDELYVEGAPKIVVKVA